MQDAEGRNIGVAPADICDYKAAVRYLRHNAQVLPGDTDKIISNGTSAGGAMSALLGATGNHPDYEPYLKEIGAAEERDDVFAASCYCPITNLDHADMAYEWEFAECPVYHRHKKVDSEIPGEPPKFVPVEGRMNEEQLAMSAALKELFPTYVESLQLQNEAGQPIGISEDGGTLQDFVCQLVCESAQRELSKGADLSDLSWLTIENGKATGIDYRAYIAYRTRMKDTPAFDSVWLGTPENELFGSATELLRHFTAFAKEYSKKNGSLAEEQQIKLMNPMPYIGDGKATCAKYFRIRHGAIDRDTSLFISALLTLKLRMHGVEVDLAYPWGVWHSGDYDLDELFNWIDERCK